MFEGVTLISEAVVDMFACVPCAAGHMKSEFRDNVNDWKTVRWPVWTLAFNLIFACLTSSFSIFSCSFLYKQCIMLQFVHTAISNNNSSVFEVFFSKKEDILMKHSAPSNGFINRSLLVCSPVENCYLVVGDSADLPDNIYFHLLWQRHSAELLNLKCDFHEKVAN